MQGRKGKGKEIQNSLIYLKGERKVSSVSFLKVVDFYVFWQNVWNKTSRKCQTMNLFKCTIFCINQINYKCTIVDR